MEAAPPTIHEAIRGRDGIIFDVIVYGPDLVANRTTAGRIEAGVGPCWQQPPHIRSAKPFALPHFQQVDRTHPAHTFYETPRRKGRKP